MADINTPNIFKILLSDMCIDKPDIASMTTGFYMPFQTSSMLFTEK